MFAVATIGFIFVILVVLFQPSIGELKGIPEWAVTYGEYEGRKKNDRETTLLFFSVLFAPAIAVFVAESYLSNWGFPFTIIRIIAIMLQASFVAWMFYLKIKSFARRH